MFSLDLDILQAVQSLAQPWLTVIMRVVSAVGTPEIIVPLIIIWLAILFIRHRRLQDILLIIILAGNAWTLVLKPVIHRPRPTVAQATIYDYQGDYSMPSGHAIAVMTIGGAGILLVHRRRGRASGHLVGAVSAGILLVGISRVYLGAHWPSDVLVGYLVGWLWLLFVWRWVRPRLQRKLQAHLRG